MEQQTVAPQTQEKAEHASAIARRSPSHKSCRMMRQRLAPGARRTAISFARAVRASSIFARFKLAMSNRRGHAHQKRAVGVTGPSSDGVVLILKREAFEFAFSCAAAGIGHSSVRRCASAAASARGRDR
jgi:hypothetical protein